MTPTSPDRTLVDSDRDELAWVCLILPWGTGTRVIRSLRNAAAAYLSSAWHPSTGLVSRVSGQRGYVDDSTDIDSEPDTRPFLCYRPVGFPMGTYRDGNHHHLCRSSVRLGLEKGAGPPTVLAKAIDALIVEDNAIAGMLEENKTVQCIGRH